MLDVATVRDTAEETTTYARVDGQSVVLLEVQKVSGGNSVAAAQNLKAALGNLRLPENYSAQRSWTTPPPRPRRL